MLVAPALRNPNLVKKNRPVQTPATSPELVVNCPECKARCRESELLDHIEEAHRHRLYLYLPPDSDGRIQTPPRKEFDKGFEIDGPRRGGSPVVQGGLPGQGKRA